jgi:hypothetical protein
VAARRLGLEAIVAVTVIVAAIGRCAAQVDEALGVVAAEGCGGALAACEWAEDDADEGDLDERMTLMMPKSAPTCPIIMIIG